MWENSAELWSLNDEDHNLSQELYNKVEIAGGLVSD
jgi:hypothetical protein